jgi:hypothetical protein
VPLSVAVDNYFWERRKGWVWPASMFIHNVGMTLAISATGAVVGLLLYGLARRWTRDCRMNKKVQ